MSVPVGVIHYPWGEDYGAPASSPRTPRQVYRKAIAYKANPRARSYMEDLFRAHFPDGRLVQPQGDWWRDALAGGDELIVLYPDAIGLGFGSLERRLRRERRQPVRVLTGRRREFVLDRGMRARLLARRALERSLVVEVLGLAALAAASVPLAAYDYLRGRR